MQITRKSSLTGVTRTLDIPVTQQQLDSWRSGTLIQDAMPNIVSDLREFIMTGITKDEWRQVFGED